MKRTSPNTCIFSRKSFHSKRYSFWPQTRKLVQYFTSNKNTRWIPNTNNFTEVDSVGIILVSVMLFFLLRNCITWLLTGRVWKKSCTHFSSSKSKQNSNICCFFWWKKCSPYKLWSQVSCCVFEYQGYHTTGILFNFIPHMKNFL